jgi:hypothetical protein
MARVSALHEHPIEAEKSVWVPRNLDLTLAASKKISRCCERLVSPTLAPQFQRAEDATELPLVPELYRLYRIFLVAEHGQV